ncbi:MAG: restriction endonuclease subunit S [Sphingobacteriales bacterium]|nr:restriction endonuclease subunit S [Sphingobacteriales bacterium]
MATLKPYDNYVPVAYDYVRQLPQDWQLLPNIAVFEERIERGHENEELLSVTIGRGVIRQTDVDIKKDSSNEDKSKYKLIKVGDIAYNKMRMWQGALGYSEYQGISSPAYVILKPKMKINPRFFHYMFRTGFYTNYSKRFSYGIVDDQLSLRYTDFKRMYSIVPPLEVQNQIVAYLDRKTAAIDKFIRNKERLIELAIENRDKKFWEYITGKNLVNIKFKESNIDCIGSIPENWETKNLNHISNVVLGKMLCNENKGNYSLRPYLKSKNIGWENVIVDEVDKMWFSKKELKIYRIQKNDLLVSEGGEVGKTCIWKEELEECYIQNSVHKITLKPNHNPIYFLYFLYILGKSGFFKSIVNQVSIGHLTREKLVKVECIVPPIEVQNRIVEKLFEEIKMSDSIISKSLREISAIKEYREALISDMVTGKWSVPQ